MSEFPRVPVFKGATRLPTFIGIPRNILIFTVMGCGSLLMWLHGYALIILVLVISIEHVITRNDDRMFHIIGLFLITKGRNWIEGFPFRARWGGSSRSAVAYGDLKLKRLPVTPWGLVKYRKVRSFQEQFYK